MLLNSSAAKIVSFMLTSDTKRQRCKPEVRLQPYRNRNDHPSILPNGIPAVNGRALYFSEGIEFRKRWLALRAA
jgi:hypothetical protein